jgi:hypothetical protein
MQSTVPVSRRPPPATAPGCRRSCPPSVRWLLVALTNCPDWVRLNDGPPCTAWAGAVDGSGWPPTGAGTGPRHALGVLATYPPAITGWAFSVRPWATTTITTTAATTARIA